MEQFLKVISSYIRIWETFGPFVASGLKITLVLAVVAIGASLVAGLALALARMSRFAAVRYLARTYIELVRGTPEILQVFFVYFALAELGIRMSAFVAAIVWLGAAGSAYVAEIYRAGLSSVDKGQIEAATALGMSRIETFRYVILPQAVVTMLAPLTNYVILQIKATSLASTIGVAEIINQAQKAAMSTFQAMPIFLVAATLYFAMCYPLSVAARSIEKRTAVFR